jgi:hypothetical protein
MMKLKSLMNKSKASHWTCLPATHAVDLAIKKLNQVPNQLNGSKPNVCCWGKSNFIDSNPIWQTAIAYDLTEQENAIENESFLFDFPAIEWPLTDDDLDVKPSFCRLQEQLSLKLRDDMSYPSDFNSLHDVNELCRGLKRKRLTSSDSSYPYKALCRSLCIKSGLSLLNASASDE